MSTAAVHRTLSRRLGGCVGLWLTAMLVLGCDGNGSEAESAESTLAAVRWLPWSWRRGT